MQKTIKTLMFIVEKTYPVNNYIFKFDIENTRTQGAKYVQSLLSRHQNFFSIVDFQHVFVCSVVSYLPSHCLDDFHYLDNFHCLHDLQKNWNLMYILKLA